MIRSLEIISKPREKVLEVIAPLTIEQLNHIPTGFRNNIIWNLGHLVAVQQGVCYKRAGIDAIIDDAFFDTYKPGSKPEIFLDSTELDKIISLLSSTLVEFEVDIQTPMFGNYQAFTSRYGIELASIEDAIQFLPFHEGLHISTIVAMSKMA